MREISAAILGSVLFCFEATAQTTGCIPPPDGLVDWWRGEGTAADSIGANDGTMIDGIRFTNAETGNGFVISGTGDDYIRLPQNLFPVPSAANGGAPFSLELWFKTGAGGVILGQQDTEPFLPPVLGSVPGLYVGTNGLVHAALFWGGGTQLIGGPAVNDNRFHHVAVTYDGSNEALYVDGVQSASAPFVQQGYSTNYWYQLGTGWTDTWPDTPGGWFPFNGIIDEVSLYNRALLPLEVAELFDAASAGKCPPSAGPALMHRYSFTGAAGSTAVTDAMRGANGVLVFASGTFPYTNGVPDGSGFSGNGRLSLAGTSGYVQLPSGLVSSLSNLTLEVWFAWNGPATSVWQRILDFGFNDQGPNKSGNGTNYMILCPARGGTGLFGFEETAVNPFGSIPDPSALILSSLTALPIGQEIYLAVTYDPVGGVSRLYFNGILVNSATGNFNPLSKIRDVNDWLGRSQWQRDPFFNGQYDELRIWEGVLSPAQISAHYLAGPDQPIAVLRPLLHLSLSGNFAILSWPTNNTGGFTPETAASPNALNWQPVTNRVFVFDNRYEVNLPVGAARAFYRLKQ